MPLKNRMYALVDANSFYASCEQVFRPGLMGKPVVVLSNNDGPIIALTKEAKALGLKRGDATFDTRPAQLIKDHNVAIFSSNYTLYGDMSARMKELLYDFSPEIEDYSIDESFLELTGFRHLDLWEYGKKLVRTIRRGIGLPTCIGIAPTKTLAKVANKFAKQYNDYGGSCVIDTEEKRIKAIRATDIGDIWGIGSQHRKRLQSIGVYTAYDFTRLPREWVRKNMSVVGERTWKELQGVSCIDLELVQPNKKEMIKSLSFGNRITDFDTLAEAVSSYAMTVAGRLRAQGSAAGIVQVEILTDRFREDLPQYYAHIPIRLPLHTSSSFVIEQAAIYGLHRIFKPGYEYKKAGVMLLDLVPEADIQQNLFDAVDTRQSRLTDVLDQVNGKMGGNALRVARQGFDDTAWRMRQERLSPCYTTRWEDILKVG